MISMRWACALAAAALVAGCAGATTVSRTNAYSAYTPSLVDYMASGGHVPTAIYGQPFTGAKQASDQAVTTALSLPGFFSPAPFEVTPNALAGEGPRVVLVFDPASFPGAEAACTQPDQIGLAPAASGLDVVAAFCYGDEPISQAALSTRTPSSPDDPQFRQALGQLMAGLLPADDPDRGGDVELPI